MIPTDTKHPEPLDDDAPINGESENQPDNSSRHPDDEKIRGAAAIGRELDITTQQAFYGLERGYIPADKYGRLWITTRRRLRSIGAGSAADTAIADATSVAGDGKLNVDKPAAIADTTSVPAGDGQRKRRGRRPLVEGGTNTAVVDPRREIAANRSAEQAAADPSPAAIAGITASERATQDHAGA
jgi:hypothetical protein